MIGNDVVDLRDGETHAGAQHPGFDRRVFRPEERDAIAQAAEPRRMRWMLWAAKEAAYKALRRGDPAFVFSPRALEVEIDGHGRGRVFGGDRTLSVQVEVDEEHVAAVARRRDIPAAALSLHTFAGPPERGALRAAVLARLRDEAERRGFASVGAALERHARIPSLRLGAALFPVSIAHHGRFAVAAVLWLRAASGPYTAPATEVTPIGG